MGIFFVRLSKKILPPYDRPLCQLKVSEQRRKRIQELETKLGELRKKVLEQQRAIK